MNLALQKYHKIYFPQPDIYERGGNFFKHFARKIKEGEKDQRPNLVIIPQSYERLLRTKEYQLRGGQRIEEALKAMDSLNGQNGDHVSIGKTKQKTNASIFSYDSDLHIAIVEDRTDGRLSEIIEILNPVVSEDYLQSIDKRQFTIVTNQHGIRSQFPRTNVHIEPPKFMMYSTAILDEWMMETELLDGNGPVARTELEDKLNTVVRFNQFFKVPLGGGNFAYWRHNPQTDQVELINDLMSPITFNKHEFGKGVLGVKPRDHEQYLLMQYGLMNEAIDTVFIHGKAGSGKTFPTTACALASTLRTSGNILNNMLPMDGSVPKHLHDIYRNMRVVGGAYDRLMFYKGGFGDSSVGFLPGGYEEKTIPSLTNFDKAMERIPFCRDTHMTLADLLEDPTKVDPKKGPKPKEKHDRDFRLPADCALVDYLNWDHVRGATLSRVFLICDEMQNSTDTLAKTILTRTADRSKRVIMADTRQIDRRGNTPDQNGFMASLYFSLSQNGGRGLPGTMFIDLTRGYRDASADVFADMPTYQ